MLKALYETFLQERRYLKNCSPMTLRSYRQAWDAFNSVLADVQNAEGIRPAVKAGVVEMMSAGKLKASSINVYLRAVNSTSGDWSKAFRHYFVPKRLRSHRPRKSLRERKKRKERSESAATGQKPPEPTRNAPLAKQPRER